MGRCLSRLPAFPMSAKRRERDESKSIMTSTLMDATKPFKNVDIPVSVKIEGREYYFDPDAEHFLPNDETEADRTRLEHEVFKLVWKENYASPIREAINTKVILDIGCGAAHWSIEWAKKLPEKTFLGIDAIPLVVPENKRPPNFGFIQCNVHDGLPFPEVTFDFAYQRNMTIEMSQKNWKRHFEEIARVVKPGGEVVIEDSYLHLFSPPSKAKYFLDAFKRYLEGKGLKADSILTLPQVMQETGLFTNIRTEKVAVPVGRWAGKVGEMSLVDFHGLFMGLKPALKIILGIDDEQYKVKLNQFAKELDSSKSYYEMYRLSATLRPTR